MCTALHMCAFPFDVKDAVLKGPLISKITQMFRIDVSGVDINLDIDCNRNDARHDCNGEGVGLDFQYSSQTAPNALILKVLDSGEVQVNPMIDTLDFLMSWMVGSQLGSISSASSQVIGALTQFLKAMVRAKASFLTLSTLAPLGMSLLPAVQKAAYAAKQVFPQDPFAGWIVRAAPMLAIPLHAVFILVVGQMFSDWFVCCACICLMIGLSAVPLFGITASLRTKP